MAGGEAGGESASVGAWVVYVGDLPTNHEY